MVSFPSMYQIFNCSMFGNLNLIYNIDPPKQVYFRYMYMRIDIEVEVQIVGT
jgi:hypothetical protein